jgi:hypothetical protein
MGHRCPGRGADPVESAAPTTVGGDHSPAVDQAARRHLRLLVKGRYSKPALFLVAEALVRLATDHHRGRARGAARQVFADCAVRSCPLEVRGRSGVTSCVTRCWRRCGR